MKRKKLKRGIAALLSVILVAGSLAVMPDNKTVVQAAGGESTAKTIAGLGTDIIAEKILIISINDFPTVIMSMNINAKRKINWFMTQ